MNPKPSGDGLTTVLYAICAFGLVPSSMFFELLAPVVGQGILAQACYWTSAIVALFGLGRRCMPPADTPARAQHVARLTTRWQVFHSRIR